MTITPPRAMTSLAAYVPWTTLRSVGNSHAVRLTVLIPLVGYLLIFNTYIVEQLALGKTVVDPASASSPIRRLLVTYFGLCSLAVGSVLYAWRCPQEIKQYPTQAAYARGDGPHIPHLEYDVISRTVEAHNQDEFSRIHRTLPSAYGHGEVGLLERERLRKAAVLSFHFRYLNTIYPRARLATAFFFGLGFLLLLLLSLQVFLRALGILWRSLT